MNQNETCLPEDLQSWLLNSDCEAEADRWSKHLEQCARCRSRIQEQTPSLAWSNILTEDAWDNELSSSTDAAKPPSPFKAIDHASLEKFAKQVIDKSDNPAMMGRLGEFEILEPIGMGGMSLVLKGYDHELNRFVAIKVLAPHLAMVGVARQRFAREAQAAASIVDPYVVPIHSVAADHDPPYLVMTFVPGQTLQATIDAEGALDVLVAVRIAYQVAMGLAAAHAQGLVHRDIKPSNILLERNVQKAFIADFGLARAADDASLTRSGFLAGTPDFMSPEQARGEAIDARSDLFSLGSVLYTMLTGHPPFRAASPMAVLNRISQDKPRPILAYNSRVPEWLSNLADRLLSKNPSDRYASAVQTAELLEGALRHLQDPVGCPLPAMLVSPNPTLQIRRKRLLAFSCVLMSVLAGCFGLAYWRPFSPFTQPPMAVNPTAENAKADPTEGPPTNANQPGSTKSDRDWIQTAGEIERDMERWEGKLRNQLSRPEAGGLHEVDEGSQESFSRKLREGFRVYEQQLDQWLLELRTEG